MKVAVVGATGMVGEAMMKVLGERNFPVDVLLPVASARSVGREVVFRGSLCKVLGLEEAVASRPDIALFSAGAAVSKEWAPRFAELGTRVIDNSSCWRQDKNVPLIVPEINADVLRKDQLIIANPNCSTIQMVLVLNPLHLRYGLERVVVSTYQSVSGTGMKGCRQLEQERRGEEAERIYPHPIDLNVIPQAGYFLSNAYTSEEVKLLEESRKILRIPELRLSGTVVRVPVYGGHSESVNIELKEEFGIEEVKALLASSEGIMVQDDPSSMLYPMPLYAEGKDEVFVGRIRRDESNPRTLNLWIVSDNLRKGAATNAVQIAQALLAKNLL